MNKKGNKRINKQTLQTGRRLLRYVTGTYKAQFIAVFICILISSVASVSVSLSLKFLLDDFIVPLIGNTDPNFSELYAALAVLGTIFPGGRAGLVYLHPSDGQNRPGRAQACAR